MPALPLVSPPHLPHSHCFGCFSLLPVFILPHLAALCFRFCRKLIVFRPKTLSYEGETDVEMHRSVLRFPGAAAKRFGVRYFSATGLRARRLGVPASLRAGDAPPRIFYRVCALLERKGGTSQKAFPLTSCRRALLAVACSCALGQCRGRKNADLFAARPWARNFPRLRVARCTSWPVWNGPPSS